MWPVHRTPVNPFLPLSVRHGALADGATHLSTPEYSTPVNPFLLTALSASDRPTSGAARAEEPALRVTDASETLPDIANQA